MTMTPEEIMTAQQQHQQEVETSRRTHETEMNNRRSRLELVRIAKETLIENARNKPASEAVVTAEEITAFANELINYVGE
jgi:hypothetical protein